MKFVHTFGGSHGTIITVKTPPIHYIVFATPHKKKYLLQKDSLSRCLFYCLKTPQHQARKSSFVAFFCYSPSFGHRFLAPVSDRKSQKGEMQIQFPGLKCDCKSRKGENRIHFWWWKVTANREKEKIRYNPRLQNFFTSKWIHVIINPLCEFTYGRNVMFKKMKKSKESVQGFTLIELIIIVAILACCWWF